MDELNNIPEIALDYSNNTINVYLENGSVETPTSTMLQTVQDLADQNKTVFTILQNEYGIYYPYYSEHYEVYPEEVMEGFLKSFGFFEGVMGNDESTMIIGKVDGIVKNVTLEEQMKLSFNI